MKAVSKTRSIKRSYSLPEATALFSFQAVHSDELITAATASFKLTAKEQKPKLGKNVYSLFINTFV